MSDVVGYTLVAAAGAIPIARQWLRIRGRARAAWVDATLDARAHRQLKDGQATLKGRLAGSNLTSTRERRWGTPEPTEHPTVADAVLTTREGPVRVVGPLVVRTGIERVEAHPPPGPDGLRVLWRQQLRIEAGDDVICSGELIEAPPGVWTIGGTDRTPLRAHATAKRGSREPFLLGRPLTIGLALSVSMLLALHGCGRAAEDELESRSYYEKSKPRFWTLACDVSLGCHPNVR